MEKISSSVIADSRWALVIRLAHCSRSSVRPSRRWVTSSGNSSKSSSRASWTTGTSSSGVCVSIPDSFLTRTSRVSSPFRHGDGGSLVDLGGDLELVHQPPRAGQAAPHPAIAAVAVLEGALQVRDTRPSVTGDHRHSLTTVLPDQADHDLAAFGEHHDVAGDLGDGGGDDGELGRREARLGGQLTALLAGAHDVSVALDRDPNRTGHRRRPPPVQQGLAEPGTPATGEQVTTGVQIPLAAQRRPRPITARPPCPRPRHGPPRGYSAGLRGLTNLGT